MIKELKTDGFIQVVGGEEVEHNFEDLEIKNGLIHLPVSGNKLEVLNYTDGEDEQSKLVAKIFAKVASVNS
jgi:hypothetical protein